MVEQWGRDHRERRYREALERIAAHDYSFDEYEQIARQALSGGDEDG